MLSKNIFEQLQNINPNVEIWWDSLPIAYDFWQKKVEENDKNSFITNFFSSKDPIIKGVTTNPLLVLQAIAREPSHWSKFCKENRTNDIESLCVHLYCEVIKKGAISLLPLWENSNGQYGWICAQVNPHSIFDYESMLQQAYHFRQIAKNIMVKIPGTNEGCKVIEKLTSEGIATNSTLNLTVSQIQACLDAVWQGQLKAKQNNIPLTRWRSVTTFMMGRFGTKGELLPQAQLKKIPLDEFAIRCAEVAICKKAYQIAKNHPATSKLLLCSLKVDVENHFSHISYHLEQTTGANCIYTCPPYYFAEVLCRPQNFSLRNDTINDHIPEEVMEKLQELPYFNEAYCPNAIGSKDFNTLVGLLRSNQEVHDAYMEIIDFVQQHYLQ